ncbi:Txe/YoeB family addiction module toxin [Pseudothauera lacus]|uniref:Txe/YoeB family addiction module toxin n=1 Tax=Pseudothauera lacus TaxID=2136175 RepID=A0A2T4IIH6_9RHOO|nr:Txe/YoeB family addiction module toxin [Pseudothauera lacus]PTD97577.1 Txe/YoeB family addiction module toxin [Pseudothauera lacus]
MSWSVFFARYAQKDAPKLAAAGLRANTQELLASITEKPFQNPPPDEKLVGDLKGVYSRRINIRHCPVYEVLTAENTVKVLRMWSHYE